MIKTNEDEEIEEKNISEDVESSLDEVQGDDDVNENDDDIGELEDDNVSNIDDEESESELDIYFKFGTNNHKLEGKHSLKRDTISLGKIQEPEEHGFELYSQMGDDYFNFSKDTPLEKGTIFDDDSRNSEEMTNRRNLSRDIYILLRDNTDIDFNANRRKPNKITFNLYYKMLLDDIGKKYTKSEIFVELAYYFTDNIFNMYKLLEIKHAVGIIDELKEKGYLKGLKSINFRKS